jgi:anti-sigma factor RsiW
MTMTLARFEHLLDIHGADLHGADLARWPQADRHAADRLLASDPAAAAALARARGLDALISGELARAGADATRVVQALEARRLPPQRRRFLWRQWPVELLDFDFAPAWPRLAALAGVAVLGFAIGLTDLAVPITAATMADESATIVADTDIDAIVFVPDPSPEARL